MKNYAKDKDGNTPLPLTVEKDARKTARVLHNHRCRKRWLDNFRLSSK